MRLRVILLALIVSSLQPALVQGEVFPPGGAESQALVERLVLERAATVAAERRVADEREGQLFAELAAKDRKLRAEQKTRRAAQADLAEVTSALAAVTTERQHLVEEIAARDRRFAAEIREYGQQIASIANSPDPRKKEALRRYAEGDRVDAFDDLVSIQEELDKANDKASAAGWRELGALALDLKDRGEKDTSSVVGVFEKAQRKDPDYARGWIELRRLYREGGRLPDARRAAEQAVAHARDDLERAGAASELSDVLIETGDLAGALALRETSLRISQSLAEVNPDDKFAQRGVAVALSKLGEALMATGDLAGAQARFKASVEVCERLLQTSAGPEPDRRLLSVTLQLHGEALFASGDLAGARSRFESSLKLRESLAAAKPKSIEAQRDVSDTLIKLGEVLQATGDLPGARSRYEASLGVLQRLAEVDQTSAEAKRDVSICLSRLGEVAQQAGDLPAAQTYYESSLKIAEQLAASNPSSADAQSGLSLSLGNLGSVLALSGDLVGARSRFEASLKIDQRLAAENPSNTDAQRDLIVSHTRLGGLPGGESHWSEALKIALELQSQGRLAPSDASMLEDLRKKAAAERAKP